MWDPDAISLLVYLAFSSSKFCVKIYTRKSKMYYKWVLGGIPLDTLAELFDRNKMEVYSYIQEFTLSNSISIMYYSLNGYVCLFW
jgi:hypothetical protein